MSSADEILYQENGLYYILSDEIYNYLTKQYETGAKVVQPENNIDLVYENIDNPDIPNEIVYQGITYPVIEIDGAFYKCQSLTTITIPSSVTYLAPYALYGCNNLRTLKLERGDKPLVYTFSVFNEKSSLATDYVDMECYIGREITPVSTGLAPFLQYTKTTKCEIDGDITLNSSYINSCSFLKTLIIHQGVSGLENVINNYVENLIVAEGTETFCVDSPNAIKGIPYLYSLTLPSTIKQVGRIDVYDDQKALLELNEINVYALTPPTCSYESPYPASKTRPITLHVPSGCESLYANSIWNDDNITIIGDLEPTPGSTPGGGDDEEDEKVEIQIYCESEDGQLEIVGIDDVEYKVGDTDKTQDGVKIPGDATNVTIAAIPKAGYQVSSIAAYDKDEQLLPSVMSTKGGRAQIKVAIIEGLNIKAEFSEQNISLLHISTPQIQAEALELAGNTDVSRQTTETAAIGHTTMHIPAGAPYRMRYTTTPGYRLSTIMLDNDEIITYEPINSSTDNSTNETSDISAKAQTVASMQYIIDLPAFEGERTLRLIENSTDTPTSTPSYTEARQDTPKLIYNNGQAQIVGLTGSETISIYTTGGTLINQITPQTTSYVLPTTLKGLYLIKVSATTFKAVL